MCLQLPFSVSSIVVLKTLTFIYITNLVIYLANVGMRLILNSLFYS